MAVKDQVVRLSSEVLVRLKEIDTDQDVAIRRLLDGTATKVTGLQEVDRIWLLKVLAQTSKEIQDKIDGVTKRY